MTTTTNSGKLVTLGILLLALLAAGVAWWNNWSKGRRAMAYWGSQAASRIRLAPSVTLYELSDAASVQDPESLALGPQKLRIVEQRDISQARGLVHARQALIQDASFNWQVVNTAKPEWRYALRFQDPQGSLWVLFDFDHALVSSEDGARPLSTNLGAGFMTLFAENR
jgi:hypothetical protein